MQTSEQIAELSSALSVAQGLMTDAIKDQSGYDNRYKFANLAQVNRIIRPALTANGLSIIQEATLNEGCVHVLTRLMHASGQWVEFGPLSMQLEKVAGGSMAQSTGSITTYARRYALCAALNIAQDADDTESDMVDNLTDKLPPIVKQLFASIRTNDGTHEAQWAALTDVQRKWVYDNAPADIEAILKGLGGSNA